MKKKVIVRPEDYTDEQLIRLIREGKLKIVTTPEINFEEVVNKVREYVSRINSLVAPSYKASIDDLWNDIFSCEDLRPLLMPGQKNSKGREFNKVLVKGIICVLQNNGIYKEEYSSPKIDSMLEESDLDTSSRRYLSQGIKDDRLRRIVSKIVKKHII